jgi:two-component system sensor histidine kinase AlgZ
MTWWLECESAYFSAYDGAGGRVLLRNRSFAATVYAPATSDTAWLEQMASVAAPLISDEQRAAHLVRRAAACYEIGVKKRTFLARETLYWLTLFAPALTLLVSNDSGVPNRLDRAVGCLLSTWTCTVVCGLALYLVVNWLAPRLFALATRTVAVAGLAVAGAAAVTGTMLAILPRLVWLDPNLAGSPVRFVLQALVVAAFYVGGARLFTWLRDRADEAQESARRSEEHTLRARLATLQAQVNPHFLFNTLNAIAALIPKEPASAEETVERLASVLQYSLASSERGLVTVAEEVAAVRDYLAIEGARFGERLKSTIEIADGLEKDAIPPMLLQPLVENAVLHGLSSREGGGAVTVQGRAEDGAMVLTVSDDGVGPGASKRHGNRIGIDNLRERLALTYGDAATLSLGARAGGGFECEIRVPRATS